MRQKSFWNDFYKWLATGLLLYALIYGMTVTMPYNPIWGQSARVIFYHVPMWFAMLTMMGISVFFSIKLLRSLDPDLETPQSPLIHDIRAKESAAIGVMFNILGLVTGIIWSRVTWGENLPSSDFSAWWAWDPIQVSALISLLIYLAYFLLRSSFTEPEQKARVSAVYNIFAAATLIPLFFIIPRMFDGLHPTAGKGPIIFDKSQVTTATRLILYPAMLGFILLGVWIYEIRTRLGFLTKKLDDAQADEYFETALDE